MIPPARHLALCGLLVSASARALLAQGSTEPAAAPSVSPRPTLNHSLVFLDPAHGGDDPGAHLFTAAGEQFLEKDLTLALGNRIRFQLSALGLSTLITREPEAAPPGTASPPAAPSTAVLSADQRAGLANHVHPFACIVLHATGAGSGVHLITSALPAAQLATDLAPATTLLPWDSAQSAFLPQSDRLAAELSTAIARTGIPVHVSHASIRPLDNLTCPAVLIELAPSGRTSPADPGYQARVAQAVATALLFWRGHAEPDATPGSSASTGGTAQP